MPDPEVTPQPEPVVAPTPEPQADQAVKETPAEPVVKQWYDSFSDEQLRSDEGITKYKSFDDFGKAFKEKDSMIGRKGVILPKEGDEADKGRFYNDLGRPSEATGYTIPEFEVEEEYKQFISEDKLNKVKDIAHRHGLSQAQFDGMVKEYTELQINGFKNIVHNQNKILEESTKKLMNEWLSDYDANVKTVELTAKSFSEGIDKDSLENITRHPDVKRLLLNISKTIAEDNFRKGDTMANENVQSLQAFIDSQVKDGTSAYYGSKIPGEQKAVKAKVKDAYAKLESLRKAGAA